MLKALYYLSLRRGLNARARAACSADVLSAFVDFDYHHYALGDALTKQVVMACHAHGSGCKAIDVHLLVDPSSPRAPTQGFILPENYVTHLNNLLPAYTCLPNLRALHLLRDWSLSGYYHRMKVKRAGTPVWPSFEDQIARRVVYPLGHEEINAFHAKHGFVPQACAPRGYAAWAARFRQRHLKGRKVVCINPRQSRLTSAPTVTYRDANLEDWYTFIDRTGRDHPEVAFIQVGGYEEWDHTLLSRKNVLIPRCMGLGLAHELALMDAADMFMGTSSGFATMATFTNIPYLICDIEHHFAEVAGVSVGDQHYPFANKKQFLMWEREDSDLLNAYLERVLELDRPARDRRSRKSKHAETTAVARTA